MKKVKKEKEKDKPAEEQTEFERQQEAWFDNNCQGQIEEY